MPKKALVAFGVAFGLLSLSIPAWNAEASDPGNASQNPAETISTPGDEKTEATSALPTLTIEEALNRVLEKNPQLAARSQEVAAREFETLQAGLRPNPELSVEVENFAGSDELSGFDGAETTARISQRFELGGKRERRQEVSRLETEEAERQYDIARGEIFAATAERFVAVLAAQKRVKLTAEQTDLTRKVLQTVEERIAAGKAAEIERVRFGTLLAEAHLRRRQARHELTAARHALATLWGSEAADFSAAAGPFEEVGGLPEWPELASLIARSPALTLQKSVSRRADQILSLERAHRVPDLTLSLGVRNDQESGDNALVAEVAIPLPFFDRNQGAVAAASARKARAEKEAEAAHLQLQAELLENWRRLRAAHSEVEVLREEIIPAAQKSFEGVTYGYQAGKYGFLDVLDAEQGLFAAKSRYIEALSAYHQAVANTERLLGQRILAEENPPTETKEVSHE